MVFSEHLQALVISAKNQLAICYHAFKSFDEMLLLPMLLISRVCEKPAGEGLIKSIWPFVAKEKPKVMKSKRGTWVAMETMS